ncbi:unnamed protein product [Vitrella brassicaformis CCMP3155]|uniref:TLDc domain-containing protein n=1 Tax=Vitrella brassicaformis (strain CCMP3155) TaxID=1169540 RepID=A0A0G4EYC1_VITBC|nr:unnamed protein product [Vitrella brassicaformis CCMP3155]|eukprot:CEM03445.1 unnamed protein product [Vitrella brassicaformis CCMP3155]
MMPFHLAELLESVPVGQRGSPGPFAKLRVIPAIKLYGIESTDACRDGLQDLQKCLVHRGCSKAFDSLRIEVHRSDCLGLLLSNFATFKALASLIDTTCSPSAKVDCCIISPAGVWRDISLSLLLAYTRFDFTKLPTCSLPLVNALLTAYNVRLDSSHSHIDCPKFGTSGPGLRGACHYVWRVTQDQLDGATSDIGRERMNELVFESGWYRDEGCSISIECAEGFAPAADAVPPEPPELKALNRTRVERVKTLIVNHRIGLGLAKAILSKGPHLTELQLTDMAPTDVPDLLSLRVPKQLLLHSLWAEGDRPLGVVPFDVRFQQLRGLTAGGGVALQLAAALRRHVPSLDVLAVAGSEIDALQVLVVGGVGAVAQLSLGFVHEGRHEFIRAADEREGITLGDHRDQLPHIDSLVMYLDVPSADVADPGAFILSSVWSVLEIESISRLKVVLPQHSHVDELKAAIVRRFGPGRMVHGQVHREYGYLGLYLTANDIATMRRAAFAHSSTADRLEALMRIERPHQRLAMITNLADTVKRLSHCLPSLPPDVSAEALASDFAGRVRAAAPMTVVDPPYAPRRLKAPLMAAMERHGLAMEPMMRLHDEHGDGSCIPSPSVIASAAQLMAVLQKTDKQITAIELLYKATEHGFAYTDMLSRVGRASPLLFLARANGDMHGFFIDTSLQPATALHMETPNGPRALNHYEAACLIFKASTAAPPTFQSPQ